MVVPPSIFVERAVSASSRLLCDQALKRPREGCNLSHCSDPQCSDEKSARAFVAFLKNCAQQKDLKKGVSAHRDLLKTKLLETNVFVGSALVSMYAKCGKLAKAREVLDRLPVRNVVSWSALIAAYSQQGLGQEALACYECMRDEGLVLNSIGCIGLLKACGVSRTQHIGEEVHDYILKQGFLKDSIGLCGALVDMYVKCGALAKAQEVLEGLPVRDVVSWSTMIAGYAEHGRHEEALRCLVKMQHDGLSLDALGFVFILKACGNVEVGKLIHGAIVEEGLIGTKIALDGAIVEMYAKFGALTEAESVFKKLPVRDVVSWCSLIAGYVQHDQGREALDSFRKMQRDGVCPDAIAFSCALKACGALADLEQGKKFHQEISRRGLLQKCIILGANLVGMYAKCGALKIAHEALERLPKRDVVTWSTLITGYVNQGYGEEAVKCFKLMQQDGLVPDTRSIVCFLKACGSMGTSDRGEKIHLDLMNQGFLSQDVLIGNALVDMYTRQGAIVKAREVINELPNRNVICWTALVAGHAKQGQIEEALSCFERMQTDAIVPNKITFLCVLNACSHAGLVEAGEMFFAKMTALYNITPTLEHHSCMIDLYGRAGHFMKAVTAIKKMPCTDYFPMWSSLLGACQKWQNVSLGRLAFDRAVHLDRFNAYPYSAMTNLYLAAGMKQEAKRIEAMRVNYSA